MGYEPTAHYDRVTEAWGLLLGPELHYGVFASPDEPLLTATNRLTERMAAAAAFSPDDEVLDVGCGTGAPACELARTHGVRVVGITPSEVGVTAATARAADAGLADRASFVVADGMDNRRPDQSFDRVWVLESSHLMRDRAALVAECARVLRPGGRMVLCDIIRRRELDFHEVKRLRKPLALLRDVFGDARMEPLEEYARLCEASGLEVERSDDLTAETRPTFTRWRENAIANRDAVVELIGEESHAQFAASCDVLEGFWDDGTLGYGLLAAVKR